MARNLTDKQQRFLDVLFDEANGDVVAAKKLAGYGDNSNTATIVESLKEAFSDFHRGDGLVFPSATWVVSADK